MRGETDSSNSRARGASLGSIPAYGDSSTEPGMLIGDVRPGGPAAKAGLKGGDRVIKIGDTDIGTVRDLMFVLRDSVPGQKARVSSRFNNRRPALNSDSG